MLAPETPFRKLVKRLKSPTSRDFDPSVLVKALNEQPEPTTEDLELTAAAIWFAAQSSGLRERFPDPGLSSLNRRLATMLGVASLNATFHTVTERAMHKARRAASAGALAFDHLSQLPLTTFAGQQLDADSIIESTADAIDSWLWDATRQREEDASLAGSIDLQTLSIRSLQRYALQSGLYYQWSKVLWESWSFKRGQGESLSLAPTDRRLATLFDAWAARQQSNSMEFAWIDISCWRQMPPERRRDLQLERSVTGIEQLPGRKRRFVIARPAYRPAHVPAFVIWRAIFEASYISLFLDRPLPRAPDINCMLLLRAWHVIYDLAGALSRGLPKPSFHNEATVRLWSLTVERTELADVIRRALDVKAPVAQQLIDFLSWNAGAYRGIWGSPLVPVPGTKRLSVARAVLAVSNPIRVAEIWLHKGGLDDNLSRAARGDSYEAYLRKSLREAIAHNKLLTDVDCPQDGLRRSSEFPEQIDLLVRLGSLLILGEVKCLLSPADPRERFNYLQALAAAAQQARRKAESLDGNRQMLERIFNITPEHARAVEIVPLVITNQGFGTSLDLEGCFIVNYSFFELYIASGSFVANAALDPRTGSAAIEEHPVYSDQLEAERKFKRYMRHPPTLKRFVDRLQWTATPFPTSSGKPLYLEGTHLKDLSGTDRARAELLRAVAQSS